MIQPMNDLAMIEVTKPKQLIKDTKDTEESGILISLPKEFPYFGFWSFAFESSLAADLTTLTEFYKQYIGKRVYWTALSEKGNMIKDGDKTYVFVKLTSLIAFDDDADSKARNVHSDGAGAFNVA